MRKSLQQTISRPIIFSASKYSLDDIKKQVLVLEVLDTYQEQLEELFLIRNPQFRFNKNYQKEFAVFVKKISHNKPLEKSGQWAYYPWSRTLLHCLDESYLIETKTARNVYLITKEEQKIFYQAKVGVAGLSVGSHVALTIALSDGAKNMKLADYDTVSLSNLNRLRYPLNSLGKNKAVFCAERIYEMNPYANLTIYNEGITEKNIEEFLLKPKIDVLIEEMDNPYLKIKIRFLARKLGIPVIMAADNGDGVIVDIERYDLNKNYPILHGILGKMTLEDFKSIPPKDFPRIIAKIAGANIADLRMLYSVTEVGKSIYSWPQLGNAATLCGSILTYLARSIILKDKKIKSGRYEVNPKEIFESGYKSVQEVRKRKLAREKFLKMLGLENK
jgi:molybdopterin/thiamine biosynthesis adenylyltransferase